MRKQLDAVRATIITFPPLECVWVHLNNIKQAGQILVCLLYCPPNSDAGIHDDLTEHITISVDIFRVRCNKCKVINPGDFKGLKVDEICNQLSVLNLVTQPSHENSVLYLDLTDMQSYKSPEYVPPVGLSRDRFVLVRPTVAPPTSAPLLCTVLPIQRIVRVGIRILDYGSRLVIPRNLPNRGTSGKCTPYWPEAPK